MIRTLDALNRHLVKLVEGRLWLQVLVGMGLGIVTGVVIGPSTGWLEPETGTVVGNWLAFPGRLFLVTIQMIVVPLVFASIVLGLNGSTGEGDVKRVALWATSFFLISTVIAAIIGIQIALLIKPGEYLDLAAEATVTTAGITTSGSPRIQDLPDMVINLLPGNPLVALVEGQMLQIVLFAFILGIAMVSLPRETSRPLRELLGALQEVCMAIVRWAMAIAPFAVFGLMAQLTSRTGLQTLVGLSIYVLTVLLGLLALVVLYLVFLRLFTGKKPLLFITQIRELLLLAFSTSSSAAVMPMSMKVTQEVLKVRRSVAEMVIPLGATINMNGTALYQAVAAVFLAQVFQIDIGVGSLALIVAMAVGASIGSPATPGVGIVILATIVSSIGVPPAGVALIIGVDRLLDMCRTSVNVMGDIVTCVAVDKLVPEAEPGPALPET